MNDLRTKKPQEHKKGWGKELWIANDEKYCGKILVLQKGKKCSIHYHKIKDETFYILEGKVKMELYPNGYPSEPEIIEMNQGDVLHLPIGLAHRFFGLEDSQIMEISTQHFEEDSYRHIKGD